MTTATSRLHETNASSRNNLSPRGVLPPRKDKKLIAAIFWSHQKRDPAFIYGRRSSNLLVLPAAEKEKRARCRKKRASGNQMKPY
jgi:hypothetical protein